MNGLVPLAVVSLVTLAAGTTSAAPPAPVPAMAPVPDMAIEGRVIDSRSRWTSDGSRIVTESKVLADNGDEVVVSQLGGTVDGLTMRTFPGPEILAPGMRVALTAHRDVDLAQRSHVVVDGVRVLYMPPQFVRTGPTKAGNYLYWESGCVFVTPDLAGTTQVPGDADQRAIEASVAAWNDGTAGCSFMNLRLDAPRETEVGRDDTNAIKFRDVSWCRPKIGDDPARCYSPAAAGLTTAVYVDDLSSSRDGAIVDADIEINGVDFAITVDGVTTGEASCHAELANTLTHELGHLLGLEHPCRTASDPPRVDGNGQPVPLCNATTDPAIIEATMYNFQDCGETKKESLTADDTGAICAIYPIAEDPGSCGRVGEDTGCCSASRDGTLPLGGGLASALVGLLVLRRRRPQAC